MIGEQNEFVRQSIRMAFVCPNSRGVVDALEVLQAVY